MNRCSEYVTSNSQSAVLDGTARSAIEKIKNEWSSQGRRVILLARKLVLGRDMDQAALPTEDQILRNAQNGLTLVGLIGIVDPPRPEIPSVMATLRAAGIRVFMVRDPPCLVE